MYDIEQIESDWYRYRRKHLLLPAILLIVLFGMAGVAYYLITLQPAPVPEVATPKPTPTVPAPVPPVPLAPSAPATPALPVATPDNASLSSEVPSMANAPKKTTGWSMTFAGDAPTETKEVEIKSSTKHIDIHVTSKKTRNTVQEIEGRFRFAKNKDDALFLARYYYDKKSYKSALKWALETNKIDSDIEESWLIFSKSKAKLGQRMEAIRVLQAYCDRSGSSKAKKLLGTIRRGKAF